MYEILETNMGRLQQLINRFNNKAKRFGLEPIQLEVQNEEYREFEYQVSEGTHARIVLKVFQVEITGAAPVLNDWFFVATLEHTPNGNIIRGISGQDVPVEYRTAPVVCEHCGSKRRRSNTYLVCNVETGEYKQVGRQCLGDFLRCSDIGMHISWLTSLTLISDSCSQGLIIQGMPVSKYVRLDQFMSCVCQNIEKKGWVSATRAKEEGIPATYKAAEFVCDYRNKEKEDWKNAQPRQTHREEALKIIEYVRETLSAKANLGEFEYNLTVIFKSNYVALNKLAFAASAYIAYQHHLEALERERLRQEIEGNRLDEFAGTVGVRETFTVTVVRRIALETGYGITRLHIMVDQKGREFAWFSSGASLEVGAQITIKGTVKEHRQYEGKKQTVLTRCKVA